MKRQLRLPYSEESLEMIEAGDEVILSGVLYVGRDQVHKKLKEAIDNGDKLPFEFSSAAIYYMGPSPQPEGFAIGAAGPTTSARMDPFAPLLIEKGLRVMVGKGPRSKEVKEAVKNYKGLYLQAYGGCGALYGLAIKKKEYLVQGLGLHKPQYKITNIDRFRSADSIPHRIIIQNYIIKL